MSKRTVPRAGGARQKAKAKPPRVATPSPPVGPQRGASLLHELSQPLTAIASFSNAAVRLAQAAPALDARLGSAVAHIAEQIVRAAEVLEQLRAFVALGESPESVSGAPRTPSQLVEAAEHEATARRAASDERLTSAALEQTAEAIVVCNTQARILLASAGAVALCGRSPLMDSFDAAFPVSLTPSPGLQVEGSVAARALGGEVLRATSASLQRGDGSRAELVISAAPLTQGTNRILGCVVTLIDVTQLRWSEEKLRHGEEQARRRAEALEAVLDAAPAAVFITRDLEGKHLEFNRACRELLRLPAGTSTWKSPGGNEGRSSFRAMRDGNEIPPEQLPAQRAATLGVEVRGYDFDLVFDDGEIRQVRCNAVPLRDEQGHPTGSVAALIDVTQMRQVEASVRLREHELRSSAERFRVALQDSPVTVATLDRDLKYTWVHNTRHGALPETVLGKRPDELSEPHDAAERMALFRHVLETGQPERKEVSGETNGVRWSYYDLAEPLLDERGEVVGLTTALIDITERKRAEDALKEADRSKSEFLALLSHELRNPLAPIRNSLYILDRAIPGGAQAQRAKSILDRQVGQLTRLADDLLDVTRLTRGKVHLDRQSLELGALLRRAAEDHRALFAAAGVELEVSPADGPLWVNGDAARLAQVVGNLLDALVRLSRDGGRVRLSLGEERGSSAVIRAQSSGAGIDPEVLPGLFEPFAAAVRTFDRGHGGLGLGLALVRGLTELHGGTATAHSEGAGRGAELVVRLPLVVAVATAAGDAARRTAARRHHRVLIIEDNVDVADSLREALGFGQHEVEVAHSGPEGLARARELVPDVMVCDIGLPGMSGLEVARAFRADEVLKGVYLVALSGYALPEDLERAQLAGFDVHLAKPPNVERLEELLARLPLKGMGAADAASSPTT